MDIKKMYKLIICGFALSFVFFGCAGNGPLLKPSQESQPASTSKHRGTFTFEIATTGINETFTLPIKGGDCGNVSCGGTWYTHNFTVSWGDGSADSTITSYDDADRIHTYARAGTYDITLNGTCEWFSFYDEASDKNKIKKLLSFTGDMGFLILNFYDCSNLDTLAPLGNMASLITARNICYGTAITSIPSGMFDGCSAITNFFDGFHFCANLTSIPAHLFDYNVNVSDFFGTFMNCTSLASIPTDLFKYNTRVTTFGYCFSNCPSLAFIPRDLFKYNTVATEFTNTFRECAALTFIPTDLFKYNIAATNFSAIFGHCAGLTSIPSDLFIYNTAATNFDYAFYQCTGLTFIPTNLFKYNRVATSFSYTFRECTGLASIPEDLFEYNTAATYFLGTFQSCTSLTTIPPVLFRNNTAVVSFEETFRDCAGLDTNIGAGLFRYNTAVTNFSFCFAGCNKMQPVINIFYKRGEEGTRFLDQSVDFTNCFQRWPFTGTQGTAPDLWNCNFGTGTPIKTNCWLGDGNSATSLTNYGDIPLAWRSEATPEAVPEQKVSTFTEYRQYLYRTIASAVVKPKVSAAGTINVAFIVRSNGAVESIKFLEGSSQNSFLRIAVAQAINNSSPFSPFPDDMKNERSKTFTVEIKFK